MERRNFSCYAVASLIKFDNIKFECQNISFDT